MASQAFAKDLDRAKLDEARSNVAEAGLLERQFAAGRVTEAYADALRQDLRKSLVKLKKEPPLASAMRAALDAIDRHDGEALSALADQLATKERALGRTG
ncbi:MAG TPA: hypothetical protein VFN88_10945 [Caulobacteraceae bacterium]|nr:hypothetical protein [Caulobacteraceae bacterium]